MTPVIDLDIPVTTVHKLHERLGFDLPLDYPRDSLAKSLTAWRMEVDDAPILRYVYRNHRPRRHLEFGTWEGTGTVYCLTESDATVWTINLLAGERGKDDLPAYYVRKRLRAAKEKKQAEARTKEFRDSFGEAIAQGMPDTVETVASDAIGSIGRFYLEAGLGHRVNQIYCDSRDWDISNYPPGFFDSVLIDGGHTPDVVTSDTHKAISLLRPGGLCLWHDFCPHPEVLKSSPASLGVVGAIVQNWPMLTSRMRDIFWIQPSYILVGIRGEPQT